MKTKSKISLLLLAAIILLTFASCGESKTPIDKDREGNSVTLPETISKVMAMGPSNTEILAALGCGEKIIAADTYSASIEGVKSDIPLFDMYAPDGEQIIALQPDVIFVTGMSKSAGDDPFKPISEAGICVVYIPSSTSIESIKEDVRYIAAVMGVDSKGETIIKDMEKAIDDIKKIGDQITDKKTVYYEIFQGYSFGTGVFLHEMIEIIGAVNIFADQSEWIVVADESILDANPDVILTSVDYLPDPVGDIKSRAGWESVNAVKSGDIYYIDTNSSNRPSHNIVKALREMAKAVYPDKY